MVRVFCVWWNHSLSLTKKAVTGGGTLTRSFSFEPQNQGIDKKHFYLPKKINNFIHHINLNAIC